MSTIPEILPHWLVFPIQVSNELFKVSGASICSDAPSYFTQYFLNQIKAAQVNKEDLGKAIKTLYIDRDPITFKDILLHLQGYYVAPTDEVHFTRLFADAQFYNLPRLISQLHESGIFISIGHRQFQIPRSLLTDSANSPNFFTLGYATQFSRPEDPFPGADGKTLIRPPSVIPSSVPNRSADTFSDLLHLLRGYPITIRDENHREELLRDARYFHFKGLEQQLIPHLIGYNALRQSDEITMRLENVQKSGIRVPLTDESSANSLPVFVHYARPLVDDRARELIVEIGDETTKIYFFPAGVRAEFLKDAQNRVSKLLEVATDKLDLIPAMDALNLQMEVDDREKTPTPATVSSKPNLIKVSLEPESAITVDGKPYTSELSLLSDRDAAKPRKRQRTVSGSPVSWIVKTGQWRVCFLPGKDGESEMDCVLVAVKIDAITSELERNRVKDYLVSPMRGDSHDKI